MRIRAACDRSSSTYDARCTSSESEGPIPGNDTGAADERDSGRASRRQHLVEGGELERLRHAGPAGGSEEGAHAVVHQLPGREDHALRIGWVAGLELPEQLL